MTTAVSLDRETIKKLQAMKSAFSNSNMVRMREAIRYLSGPKLSLFINIPFFLNANLPGLPGFVEKGAPAHGIVDFKKSGFFKAGLGQGLPPQAGEYTLDDPPPCILGLYHIGSLGTFTQSSASDFDYWIIIDKHKFSRERHFSLKTKLSDIVRHARESCGQKVTFFIMDQGEIRRDCYAGLEDQETLAAPKLFLKEEFYRTFLYIAGKLPLWVAQPPGAAAQDFGDILEKNCAMSVPSVVNRDFLDLGRVGVPVGADILRGILWHIVKSRSDPVKALIKATMIYSHRYGAREHSELLCDMIKAGYSRAGIDDYEADPYKVLFDRIIAFHEVYEPKSINLIKNAVFLRLCGFPNVSEPEKGAPKRQLLDRYIRRWNLKPSQVKKIFSYRKWAEGEKQLLEQTFINRLSQMYTLISKDISPDSIKLSTGEKRNLTVLYNKARERVNRQEGKIYPCSTFLRSQPFNFFLLQHKRFKGWELSAYRPADANAVFLHRSEALLELMGWIMENGLYHRSRDHIKLDTRLNLFESADTPLNPDGIYVSFAPAKPLSDDSYAHPPEWKRLGVLLDYSDSDTGPANAEFLGLNSWGEFYVSRMALDTAAKIPHRYKQIAQIINQYSGANLRLHFFQLAGKRDPEVVYQLKQYLDRRFLTRLPGTFRGTRPMLDKL